MYRYNLVNAIQRFVPLFLAGLYWTVLMAATQTLASSEEGYQRSNENGKITGRVMAKVWQGRPQHIMVGDKCQNSDNVNDAESNEDSNAGDVKLIPVPGALVYISKGLSGEFSVAERPTRISISDNGFTPNVFGIIDGNELTITKVCELGFTVRVHDRKHGLRSRFFPRGGGVSWTLPIDLHSRTGERVHIYCNDTSLSRAVGVVMSHPFFVVTSGSVTPEVRNIDNEEKQQKEEEPGSFIISDLPIGSYEITAWHPNLGGAKRIIEIDYDSVGEIELVLGGIQHLAGPRARAQKIEGPLFQPRKIEGPLFQPRKDDSDELNWPCGSDPPRR